MGIPETCDVTKSVFDGGWQRIHWGIILCAFVLALYSLWKAIAWVNDPSCAHKTCKAVLYTMWVLGPPIWFFFEYFYLFRQHGKPECIETFKYGQELASRIWLALVAVLGVLFFSKELLSK